MRILLSVFFSLVNGSV